MIWGLGSIISTVIIFLFIVACVWIAISILENFLYIILILAGVIFPLLCLIVRASEMARTPIWFDWPYRTNLILTIVSSCWFGLWIIGDGVQFIISWIIDLVDSSSYTYYATNTNTKNNNSKANNNKSKQVTSNKKHKLNLSLEAMKKYDNFFANYIIGQDFTIFKIKEQLISLLYDIDENSNRSASVFFFARPTRVGKTETCKILSKFLYITITI